MDQRQGQHPDRRRTEGGRTAGRNRSVRESAPRSSTILPPEVLRLVFKYASKEDLRNLCTVARAFRNEATRALYRHLDIDVDARRGFKALLKTLGKNPGLSRLIRTVTLHVTDKAYAQGSFRALLGHLPTDLLSCISFHLSSRLSELSTNVYIQFLLGSPKVAKAVIPETYSPSEILVRPEDVPSVAYRVTYARSHLREIVFLGSKNRELVDTFFDGSAPIVQIDVWGQSLTPMHQPMMDEAIIGLLHRHKKTIRSMRFSRMKFPVNSTVMSNLLHDGHAAVEELQIRDCWNNQVILEAPKFLENLRTLFVEDISMSKMPCRVEALEILMATLPPLESLGLHLQIESFHDDERTKKKLPHQPDLRKILYTHRDSLKRLIVRFGGVKADYDYVTPVVETCQALTHFGFPDPVAQGNPMQEGTFTPNWRYYMSDIKQYLMYTNVRNVHVIFPTPHQMRPALFNKNTNDRHRIIAQEIYDIMNKDLDGRPGVNCVSVTMRPRRWHTSYPLPKTRSFRQSGDSEVIEDEDTIWTEFGGYARLVDFMRAEFRHF